MSIRNLPRILSLSLGLGFMSLMGVRAESCLQLSMKDGSTHDYVLTQQPRIAFASDSLHITSPDAEATFALADIQDFHFADVDMQGIAPVHDRQQRLAFVQGVVTIEGYEGQVSLTDLSGRTLMTAVATRGQSLSLDLTRYPQGAYIIRLGRQSLKLMTK